MAFVECRLQMTADFLTHIIFPFPLLRANFKQATLSAIQASLSAILA